MEMKKLEPKTIVFIVLILLAVIFVIQNLGNVPFKILFVTVQMPGIIFYSLLLGIGFLLGFLFVNRKK